MEKLKSQIKVDWINIIYNNEFLRYLDSYTTKEISLVSKQVRKKLESVLFKNIELTEDKLKFQSNPFNLYFEYLLNYSLGIETSENGSDYKNTNVIDQWISEVAFSLSAYKTIVNRFNLTRVEKAGYYMLPLFNIFGNLKFLRLESCSIPFTAFSNLSESLLNLEVVELVYVTFAKFSSDNISHNQFDFPQNLTSLKIYNCDSSIESALSPEEFLFNDDKLTRITSFLLPECSVPSLKELGFFSGYGIDGGINQFIELNPQLESLIIESSSLNYITLNLIKSLTSIKSLELRGPLNLNPETEVPTLDSMNKLSFDDVNLNSFEIVKKMCLSCPNLTGLHFDMVAHKNFKNTIDNHIAQIVNYLPKLKFFSLIIVGNIFEKISFSAFYLVEALVVESGQLTILNIDFESCTSLRRVTFKSFPDINTTEFKNKFNSISEWKFKYSSSVIKGYRIS